MPKLSDKFKELGIKEFQLLDSISELVSVQDKDLKILWANKAAADSIGSTPKDLIGMHCYEIWEQSDKPSKNCPVLKAIKTGIPCQNEMSTPDGRFWLISGHPIKNDNGEIIGAVEITIEITKLKETEKNLKESEEKFRELFNNMSSGFVIYDAIDDGDDFIIKDMNKTSLAMSEMKKRQILDKKVTEIFPAVKKIGLFSVFQKVWKTGTPEYVKPTYYDDKRLSAWVENYVFKLPSGEIVASYNDVTKRKEAEEIRIESEKKFKALFKGIPTPSYTWQKVNDDFILVDYSDAAARITQGDVQRFLGMKASEMYKERPDIIEDLNRCFEEKTYISKEMSYYFEVFKDYRHLLVQYAFIPPDLVLAHTIDLTEKKRAEQELKESEEKYRYLFDRSPYSITIVDVEGNIVDCNSATEHFLSAHSKNDLIGKNFKDIFSWNEENKLLIPIFEKRIQSLLNDKVLEPFDFPLIQSIGDKMWVHGEGSLIKIENEKFMQFIISDITEQKRAEKELKESEERYRHLFERSPYSISIVDLEGTIIDCNSATDYFLSAHNRNDLIGHNFKEIFSWNEDDKNLIPMLEKKIEDLLKGVAVEPFDFPLTQTTGNIIWVQAQGSLMEIENKKFIQFIISNITEKKKAEQKLKESEEKYRIAYNLANLYRDLFAHDMNNVLQNILSSTDLLSMYKNYPVYMDKVMETLTILRKQVKRGANLISNVQKLSQLEEIQYEVEQIEILSILQESVDFLEKSSQGRELQIKIDSTLETCIINGNELLRDVFDNILNNAVKYNDNTIVNILIKISKTKKNDLDFIKFEFIDNGIGIEDEQKKVIFQRVGRQDKSLRGMGLGLSLVKKIIDNYNGEIWVENKVPDDYSKGSNFVILLPEVG